MKNTNQRHRNLQGTSLIQILLFLSFFSFLIIPIISLFDFSGETASRSRFAAVAQNLLVEMVEETKALNFDEIESVDWTPVSGNWTGGIQYPDNYNMFERHLEVLDSVMLPGNPADLKFLVATIRWREFYDNVTEKENSMQLVTTVSNKI